MKKRLYLMILVTLVSVGVLGCSNPPTTHTNTEIKTEQPVQSVQVSKVEKLSLEILGEKDASVEVKFSAADNAEQYEIYRKRIARAGKKVKDDFKLKATVEADKWVDTNVRCGDTYIYRVRGVGSDGTTGEFSKSQKARVILGYSKKQLAAIERMITEKGTKRGKIVYTKKEIKLLGAEILINKHNYLNDKFSGFDIVTASGLKLAPGRPQQRVSSLAHKQLKKMFKAASKDGVTLWAFDIYRTLYQQTTYHNNKIYYFKGLGYADKDARVKASTITAIPNTSEHQSGLAIDIISPSGMVRDSSFAKSQAGKWLAKNSWKYGFILRYLKNKIGRTEIIFEPWHYRYVGKGLARLLYEEGICLEEYYHNIDKYNAKYVKYKED